MSGEMLDKMYIDFTEKVIPVVQEGMQITKEYFTDLFTRYVQYLLLTDILASIIWLIVGIVVGVVVYKCIKSFKSCTHMDEGYILCIGIGSAIFIGCMSAAYSNTTNAIKAVFIPEVRVYEELQSMRSNTNN